MAEHVKRDIPLQVFRAEIFSVRSKETPRHCFSFADGSMEGPGGTGRDNMTTIYLMRHGETDWNRQERMQGQLDCPLNENGRRQAAEAGRKLMARGLRFDRVYSSPLCRALETARIVSGMTEKEILTDGDLMEMGFGPYEGISFSLLPSMMFAFFSDPERFPAPEGMEPIPHLKERTGRFLERLRTDDPGGTVLVMAHGVTLRVLLGHLMGQDWDRGWKMPLENCCVYRVEMKDGAFGAPEKVDADTRDPQTDATSVEENARTVLGYIRRLDGRRPVIVAIDGRCAAGKTTLAAALAREAGYPVVHMDVYFPQPYQRTAQRLATPGGNVDYERFLEEVLTPLRQGRTAFVRPYSCQTGQLGAPLAVPESPVILVEGSYACHPDLWDSCDLHVFVDVDPQTQWERILRRDGPEKAEVFRSRWIPMEELYFAATGIARRCELYLK